MAELIDNAGRSRFEMVQEGLLTHLDYAREGGLLRLLYIEVPRELKGRGFAAMLLREVLTWARDRALQVVPVCSYVQIFLRRHPEYDDLAAGRSAAAPEVGPGSVR